MNVKRNDYKHRHSRLCGMICSASSCTIGINSMVVVVDGGLASTLQESGYSVDGHPLWSAHLLHTNPDAVLEAHSKFVEAGANIITSASYQASTGNIAQHLKLSSVEAISLMKRSVEVAKQAAVSSRHEVLVAGSIGPYGACLADGSEYNGNYLASIDQVTLKEWHRPRVAALVSAGADVLAVETVPGPAEALAVLDLLREYPDQPTWVAFSCQDGQRTCDGSLFSDAAAAVCAARPYNTLAVGVNCSEPVAAAALLHSVDRRRVPLPLLVYPNSGEQWSGDRWTGGAKARRLASFVPEYLAAGAVYIGGCCRVGPDQIREVRHLVDGL
ncbi:homocysteine S-methyltransferase YbgG-like isoform X2 [Pollicipes pollicipes]|uniref:homocysteine S-methyltransferase YbgG-like isoform X2 n=1 Tax=Pollicipes pollicipes TaxID=41117 RepID=UPI0018859D62|nr:homocysteine S-methyltransferase YbgG-like isoform X2 [Pollicipes pollicipes]